MIPRPGPRPNLIAADGCPEVVMHLPLGTDAQIEAAVRIIHQHAIDADDARELMGLLGVDRTGGVR